MPTEPGTNRPPTSSERLSSPSVASGMVDFGQLSLGDSIVVMLQLDGCFQHSVHRLVFRAEAEGAAVSLTTLEGNAIPEFEFVAPAHLDRTALRRLDETLNYYRTASEPGMCTSSTSGELTMYRNGIRHDSERFHDSSCPSVDDEHMLELGALIDLRRRPRSGDPSD